MYLHWKKKQQIAVVCWQMYSLFVFRFIIYFVIHFICRYICIYVQIGIFSSLVQFAKNNRCDRKCFGMQLCCSFYAWIIICWGGNLVFYVELFWSISYWKIRIRWNLGIGNWFWLFLVMSVLKNSDVWIEFLNNKSIYNKAKFSQLFYYSLTWNVCRHHT
jgi:hypothetical protein